MRAYIICDMVGACGVWDKSQCEVGTSAWRKARQEITLDVNAAIEALKRVGYHEILIKDIHGRGTNLLRRMLIPEVKYESGIYLEPVPILGKMFGGTCAVLIGFHAKAGTSDAFYPHTFRDDVASVKVNGRSVGEVELISWTLGCLGIEVDFVSGDEPTVRQAKEAMPWVETMVVPKEKPVLPKAKSISEQSMFSIKKRNEIRSLVQRSCNRSKSKERTLLISTPVEFEVSFQTDQEASQHNSWGLHQEGKTIHWSSADYLSGYRQLINLLYVPRSMRGFAPQLYRLCNWTHRLRDGVL